MIWFGVLVVLMVNTGSITPPYAFSLFLLRAIGKEVGHDIPIGVMYRGIMPFVVSSVVVALMIFFVPPLATWLAYLR
jgi:TRAP-type mannitol/chloroaromatic compound transport system permease large subunit